MPTLNLQVQQRIIPFKPAQLKANTEWLIVYYYTHPITNKAVRFRHRVPNISPKRERLKYAQRMIDTINEKLYKGWSPFENSETELKTFEDCLDAYKKNLQKDVKNNVKRTSTVLNYITTLKTLKNYLKTHKNGLRFISQIDQKTVVAFLDNLYMLGLNPNSYNFHFRNLNAFFSYCTQKGWIKDNPLNKAKKKKTTQKIRTLLTETDKQKIQQLKQDNPPMFTLCMATYFCFIRPSELKNLKVSDVNLDESTITIRASISKNKKTETVTIPLAYHKHLTKHIQNAKPTDFLFGKKIIPNHQPLTNLPYLWQKIRKEYNLSPNIQFYSLKDTGITDLLNAGVPAIKVRDQARHSDLSITETYTHRKQTADDTVKNSSLFI